MLLVFVQSPAVSHAESHRAKGTLETANRMIVMTQMQIVRLNHHEFFPIVTLGANVTILGYVFHAQVHFQLTSARKCTVTYKAGRRKYQRQFHLILRFSCLSFFLPR